MKIIQKKICLLGDFSVGKTSLIRRYVEERFDENYLSTIGIHMSRKRLRRNEHFLDLFIWDLAGGEDFTRVGQNYLRGATAAIIVCDLTRKNTLPALTYYADQVKSINPNASLLIVGNKFDLSEERVIFHDDLMDEISAFCDSYLLTSAKSGHNVKEAFAQIANMVEK